MIDEAPLLTVKRGIQRPDAALVRGFVGLSPAMISDAMGCVGGLDYRIGPRAGARSSWIEGTVDNGSSSPVRPSA